MPLERDRSHPMAHLLFEGEGRAWAIACRALPPTGATASRGRALRPMPSGPGPHRLRLPRGLPRPRGPCRAHLLRGRCPRRDHRV